MSGPCERPECGGVVHTDPWGTPVLCPHESAVPCTASFTDDLTDGTVHCVLPAGHQDPEHGVTHTGPGDPFTRLRWYDWAKGATPHQPKPEETAGSPEPEPSEFDRVRADNESLRYQIRRAREALATDEPNSAEAAVARVRALHRQETGLCEHCTGEYGVTWPCATVRAINGELP
ncbi:hypothetical protein [Streptomyces sp. SID4982]|uniref:hypothetical protein n=1 Tax=Streptomyces sp. SID4982 TaxID=2690291 RepID=UPI001371C6DC|nr:hypothetical protein [Streptomyces sp. SID4982]MYS15154.1 hypothetical protein [Streptomyces sp. SID4982]